MSEEQIRTEQMNAEHIENRRQTIEQEIQETGSDHGI